MIPTGECCYREDDVCGRKFSLFSFYIVCAFPARAWYLEVGSLLFACLLWDSGAPVCGEYGFSFHCCAVLAGFPIRWEST